MGDSRDSMDLRINGRPFTAWKSASVDVSIEQADRRGSLSCARQADNPKPAALSCPVGASVEVYAVDRTGSGRRDLLLTGSAEGRTPSGDASGCLLSYAVYSRTLDVVLSEPLVGPVFQGLTRLGIVRALCAPHGVEVVLAPGLADSAPIPTFKVKPGETVYRAINRLCEPAAWLISDDAQGRLVLTQAGLTRAATALEWGRNVKRLGGPGIDATQRYSIYSCRGQRAGDDLDFGAGAAQPYGSATDAGQPRVRRLSVDGDHSTDAGTARALCRWEAAQRAGRSVGYEVTVVGFRQSEGGPLWTVNELVQLVVPWAGIDSELLVVGCRYEQTETEHTTVLRVAPAVGYQPFLPPPLPPRTRKKRGGIYDDVLDYMATLGVRA